MKIIYNVTVSIDYSVQDEWVDWMRSKHIKDVMATGMFLEARFSRILAEESGGASYSIQYLCENMEKYDKYVAEYSSDLQKEHMSKYSGKFAAFRTLLQVEDEF
jgi:hypothetical protein